MTIRLVSATRAFFFASLVGSCVSFANADSHPTGVPVLNSNPGASYTLYLDFSGFNFTGTWAGYTPGNVPAYFGATTTFTASQQNYIKQAWARIAENYSSFNINVTTIDPAATAGQADTDAHRQAYYDANAKVLHSVIGGNGFIQNAGGVSFIGTAQYSYPTGANNGAGYGYHTNWLYAAQAPTNMGFVGEGTAHEDGHMLSLYHQGDYTGNVQTAEYSSNGNSTGNGSYAPIMGVAYYSQRGLWRVGNANVNGVKTTQNDVLDLLGNIGIGGFVEDGIGHTFDTATELAVNGNAVDYNLAKGIISPISTTNPNPIGESNYTTDFYTFKSLGGTVTLTAYDASEYITPGTPDPGGMLDSVLRIYNSNHVLVGTGALGSSTLYETFTGNLSAGLYYAQIASVGGYTSTFDPTAKYYTMGSYFLTGSGIAPVPEPTTLIGLALGLGILIRRRRPRA